MDLLIRGARILEYRPARVGGTADIAIEKGLITGVEKTISGEKAKKTIDASGCFVMPGHVCAHNHFYSALARGITAAVPPCYDFVGVLQNLWWRLDRALDRESLFYSGLVGALEAIRCGTTTVIDHSASPSFIKGSLAVLKEGFERCGLRGILCYEVTDRNGDSGRDEGVSENVSFIESGESALLRGAVGAHAPFTLSDETLVLLSEACRGTERGIHVHVSEDRYDLSFSHHTHGISPVERLERFGLLGPKSIIVHGVHLLKKEIALLNEHDSFLVHNPRSNMNNGVGYNTRLAAIKNVAIGTDGIGSDMFEETKIGYFKGRDAASNLAPADLLGFLGSGAQIVSRYFERKAGTIEPGCLADLVLLDYKNPTPLGADNLPGHFVFGFGSHDVRTVVIDGRCVFENGEFPFDTGPIYKEAAAQAEALWKRMEKY
ncbi:MAG: putative aminohydrolase SsnA [Spirochaetes bacterium]|nr:putative aminohydrolase SsnA [Spirochaetota bacterium]